MLLFIEKLVSKLGKFRNLISGLLYAVALLILDVGFRYIYRGNVTIVLENYVTLILSVICITILTAICFLLPRLARRIYIMATSLFFVIFSIVHAFFYSFSGKYLNISSMIFAGDAAAFFDWSYFSIPKKFILLIFVVLILLVAAVIIVPKVKYSKVSVISSVLAIFVALGGFIFCKNRFFTEEGQVAWFSTYTPAEVYESFSDSRTCLHMVGLYQYTFNDIAVSTGIKDWFQNIKSSDVVKNLDEKYENKSVDPDNEMTGVFEDKNLILIQLESIDGWMVNDVSMPFLTKLQSEAINFTNFYAPKFLAAATFNTELIVNTGQITPTNSAKISYFTKNYYPYSAANLFKDKGYLVESYHRSAGSIYNREETHLNWGYTKYNTGAEMNMENVDLDSNMLSGYNQFVKDEKFMSFIITYSGHGPYSKDDPEVKSYYDIIKPQLAADAEEEYIYALCHAYETDLFIKLLYEQLEKDGKLEDTVFVLYTDHYDHYVSDEAILLKYKNCNNDSNLLSNVPFMIYNKGMEGKTVEKTVSSFDVLPTIVNLFNLNTDGRYYVGNDAFSENGGYVFFQNNSWIQNGEYFDINTSKQTEASKQRALEIKEKLNLSFDSVKIDYFAKKEKN